jgi:hypothetical protein
MSYRTRRLRDIDSELALNFPFGDLTESPVSFAGQPAVFNATTNVSSLKRNVGKAGNGGGNDEAPANEPQLRIL